MALLQNMLQQCLKKTKQNSLHGSQLNDVLFVSPQEEEDLALAQALAASEQEYRRQQQRQQVRRGKLSRH